MDIRASYDLAIKLGYDEHCVCTVNYGNNGVETFWWNGLQIPSTRVYLIRNDGRWSGRYPRYLTLANEKGMSTKDRGL